MTSRLPSRPCAACGAGPCAAPSRPSRDRRADSSGALRRCQRRPRCPCVGPRSVESEQVDRSELGVTIARPVTTDSAISQSRVGSTAPASSRIARTNDARRRSMAGRTWSQFQKPRADRRDARDDDERDQPPARRIDRAGEQQQRQDECSQSHVRIPSACRASLRRPSRARRRPAGADPVQLEVHRARQPAQERRDRRHRALGDRLARTPRRSSARSSVHRRCDGIAHALDASRMSARSPCPRLPSTSTRSSSTAHCLRLQCACRVDQSRARSISAAVQPRAQPHERAASRAAEAARVLGARFFLELRSTPRRAAACVCTLAPPSVRRNVMLVLLTRHLRAS